jgi:hypothetical protein
MRLGFATGPTALIDKINMIQQVQTELITWHDVAVSLLSCFPLPQHDVCTVLCLLTFLQATSLHASGISQLLALKFLQSMGEQGWQAHTAKVALHYARRRDVFMRACDKHLTGLAEWNRPSAGMFVWFKLLGIDDSKSLIEEKAVDAKVLLVPGTAFSPTGQKSSHVRASFSTATDVSGRFLVMNVLDWMPARM